MSGVYGALGCAAKCGRCAHTIRNMLAGIKHYVTPEDRADDAVTAL
jgi:bacterioferritin-associated ferredoxin